MKAGRDAESAPGFYEAYLRTPYWRETRAAALRRAGFVCEWCGEPAENVHHRTYARLGNERPDDLLALCRLCHLTAHGKRPTVEQHWSPEPKCPSCSRLLSDDACTCWDNEPLIYAGMAIDNGRLRRIRWVDDLPGGP